MEMPKRLAQRRDELIAMMTEQPALYGPVELRALFNACWEELAPEVSSLRSSLAIAREALGFYADNNNWSATLLVNPGDEVRYQVGDQGTKARQALARLEGE